MKKIITYWTYDMLYHGHVNLLKMQKQEMGREQI